MASQHKAFVYLYDWLGLKEVAVLEPKPGVEPTVSHLQEVLAALKAHAGADGASTPPTRTRGRPMAAARTPASPAVKLPFTVGGSDGAKDLFGLFDDTVARLLAAAAQAMNWSALDWGILGPAAVAGLLVLATHVPLGMQVLDRGIVFIDLAIAQIAGLGVIAADALGLPRRRRGGAGGGGQCRAARRRAADLDRARAPAQQQEALIGVLFILAACAGILLLASNPHGGEHLKDLLVGQILWVDTARSWLGSAAVVRRVLLAHARSAGLRRLRPLRLLRRVRARGHRVGAAGRRVPGVLEPDHPGAGDARASAGRRRTRVRLCASAPPAIALGLALSALFDLPSGAVIVWTLALCGLVVALQPAHKEKPAP